MPRTLGSCLICDSLSPEHLVELDLLMGDPSRWPSTVWGIFAAPNAPAIPPPMKRWGAVRLGLQWLNDHGYDFKKGMVYRHFNEHVPMVAVDAATLVANGVLAAGSGLGDAPDPLIDPMAYLTYYTKGIAAGVKGLELLMKHVAEIEAAGKPVPLPLIKQLIDVGAKLSTSQAAIKARNPDPPASIPDTDFMAGPKPLPSPRFGHQRIREVEGEVRPVRDEGPRDRETYNARMAQEGRAGL